MLKVGITGGIGSGKTIVSKLFSLLGVPVYNADDAAKNLMNNNLAIKTALLQQFGTQTYKLDGLLNREWLAANVFKNPEKLLLLNSIVHPVVIADSNQWMDKQLSALVMKEAALLFESGSYKTLDYIIGVYAPELLRIKRVLKRDGSNAEDIRNRMRRQMNEAEKMSRSHFVLQNDESQLIIPQVTMLYNKLLQLAEMH